MARTRHHGDKAKRKTFGRLWWWFLNEPKWWRKLMHTRPRRAAEKQSLHEAVKHPERDVIHPLDRKPHKYYW